MNEQDLGPSRPIQKHATRGKIRKITGFGVVMLFVLAFAIFFQRNFSTVMVRGDSMHATLKNGQRLLATDAYWLVGEIQPNDIVVFQIPGKSEYYIKRVYKLGGEPVDWLNAPRAWKLSAGEYQVPQGMVYVLGDNRSESEDSRIFGPLSPDQILGKVVVAN